MPAATREAVPVEIRRTPSNEASIFSNPGICPSNVRIWPLPGIVSRPVRLADAPDNVVASTVTVTGAAEGFAIMMAV